jgi:phenylacetate-CoA ligase
VLSKIYSKAPVFVQNLGISAYGLYWYYRRFGGEFNEQIRKFKEREYYTKSQWEDYQTIELRKLLIHAFEHVEFYRNKYQEYGFSKNQFAKFQLDDLKRLPYLEKNELRKYGTTTLLSSTREKGSFYGSSGSTGTPTQIYFSKSFHQRWSALFETRIRHWAGVNKSCARGMIGGRKVITTANAKAPFYRVNHFEKQVYFSAYHISKANLESYRRGIEKYKLDYMTGYASSNYFLAQLFLENNIQIPRIRAVITSSEKLTQDMRDIFRKVYDCDTFDSYSGVEACGLISENEFGELLFSPDSGILELINDNGEYVKPGEYGEVVSTGLLNFDQPLIRYRIGDIVTLNKNQLSKSTREMPIISEIEGRVEDKITTKDGRVMVRFHSVFIGVSSIERAQVIQHSKDLLELKIQNTIPLSQKELDLIRERVRSQLGRVTLKINQHQHIGQSKSGKYRAVISKLK